MDVVEIIKRFRELESDRKGSVEQTWDLIERFIAPIRGGKFFQSQRSESEVEWRRREVFDDTAISATNTLAAAIHGSLTSPAVKWFDLKFKNRELNENIVARDWLQDCSEKCWQTLQESNFNLEVSEGYLDLVPFGNMVITEETADELNWKGIDFNAIPIRESYFEEDAKGQPLRYYRRFSWKPAAIIDKFGADGVPETVTARAVSAASERMEFVMCIWPRKGRENADVSKIMVPKLRPFGVTFVLLDCGQGEDAQLGEEGGYYEMPAWLVRWRRASGSMWGYGPGATALPTVMTTNLLVKLILRSAEKAIDPPMMVQERGLLADLDVDPAGINYVKDAKSSVLPMQNAGRFDVSQLQLADLRAMINRIFHIDQLELKQTPQMSATEASIRYEMMNRLLGPTMGRLTTDFLDNCVNRTFMILFRAKQFDDMPSEVSQADFEIDYVGPLSRAQKAEEVTAIERWLVTMQQMGQTLPELNLIPNPDTIGKIVAEKLNIPARLLRTDAELATIRDKMEKQAEQEQQLAAEQQQADIAKTSGEAQQAGGM